MGSYLMFADIWFMVFVPDVLAMPWEIASTIKNT